MIYLEDVRDRIERSDKLLVVFSHVKRKDRTQEIMDDGK